MEQSLGIRVKKAKKLIEMFESKAATEPGEEEVADSRGITDLAEGEAADIGDGNIEPETAASGAEADLSSVVPTPAAELEVLIERLERVTSRLERLQLVSPATPAPTPVSAESPAPLDLPEPIHSDNMSVNGYQDIVQGPLRTWLDLSHQIGGDVGTHADLVNKAFQAQFSYIQLATQRSKPSDAEQSQLLKPTSDQINAIQQFREKNRTSPFFNHLSAISESIPALGWVAVSPTPAPYVKEMNDAGQFYTNRVLKEWKEKDKRHAEWCRAWVQLLTELQAYVKQHHTTGLVWSGKYTQGVEGEGQEARRVVPRLGAAADGAAGVREAAPHHRPGLVR
ncbi:adenylyl cyclase-associated protein 2 [Phthorimaea operculella]|nr:adenylyl cyclase-associated protein 2 [Phthorimaea operculella]